MAEPDTGGPAPSGAPTPERKPRRRHTLASVIRDIERSTAPVREEMARVEKVRRQREEFGKTPRRLLAELGIEDDEDSPATPPAADAPPPPATQGAAPPAGVFTGGAAWPAGQVAAAVARTMRDLDQPPAEPTPPPPPPPPPPPRQERPPFEIDPPARLVGALREVFPGFTPTDRWWIHVECEVKTLHHRSSPTDHDAFCVAYWGWGADDLLRYLESAGLVKKARRPRGPSVCELLRDLHREDPDFAETATEREVATRIGKRSAGALSKSAYWVSKLKPRRAEIRAQKKLVRGARRYGTFDGIGQRDEEPEGH